MRSVGRVVTPSEVAERLRSEASVLVVVHEAPDGDAFGCLSAFVSTCQSLGVACRSYVPGTASFPSEYGFLPNVGEAHRGKAPEVDGDTTIYFLDCASMLRGDSDGFPVDIPRVNIDHHQDNPGYGDLNLLDVSAASTTMILHEVFKVGGFSVDAQVATALYVGLVTDTGRFQYSNTTAEVHRVAAELIELGCDVDAVGRQVYESIPLPKLRLLERVLARLEVRLDGAVVTSWLGNGDFLEIGADEGYAGGLIDTLRSVAGTRVAVLARERERDGRVETKLSLRSSDDGVDVAELAHERGGGGHVRAAGLTMKGSASDALGWVESRIAERL